MTGHVLHAIIVTWFVGDPGGGKVESDLYLYSDDEVANRKYDELRDELAGTVQDGRRVLAIEQLGVPVDAETEVR